MTDSTGEESSSGGSSAGGSTGEETSETGSTGGPAICGDGQVDDGEACDDGQETALCDDDCTPAACGDAKINAAAGEDCDDGNADDGDGCIACALAVCGDGLLQVGVDECDDGNLEPGDGCDTNCVRERWAHVGVAKDVPIADLHGWKQCWSDTYEAGDLVDDVKAACAGDRIMIACMPVGSDTLTVAYNAPRMDVFFEPQVDYNAGERHAANGISWYWAPYHGKIGAAPAGNTNSCELAGEDDQMCWWVTGNIPQELTYGYRCGSAAKLTSANASAQWRRVVFETWD
jgi:cysteine-rich repeat protein